MAAASDQQRKDRLIAHMNRDHQRSLAHYLRHYASVSPGAARSASLRDFSFSSMAIVSGGKEHIILIDPPLSSWADTRTRLAEMDVVARDALGLSDVFLDKYTPPRRVGAVVFGAVVFYIFCYATLPWVAPGSRAWEVLDAFWPGKAAGYVRLVKRIFWPVLAIHTVECVLLDKSRLQPYGVDRFSKLWWKWEASCFIEGFDTFARTKRIVERKRAEKDGKAQ